MPFVDLCDLDFLSPYLISDLPTAFGAIVGMFGKPLDIAFSAFGAFRSDKIKAQCRVFDFPVAEHEATKLASQLGTVDQYRVLSFQNL